MTAQANNQTITSVVRLAVSNPLVTDEQLAATDFEPDPRLRDLGTNKEILEAHEDTLRNIAVASRVALSILGKSKPELIEAFKSMDRGRDTSAQEFCDYLSKNADVAESLFKMIRSAETRAMVVFANLI